MTLPRILSLPLPGSNTFPSLRGQPFSSESALRELEESEARKSRLSRLSWFADVWHIRASTLGRIWKAVVVVTLWTTLVAVLAKEYDEDLNLTNQVVPVLSVVVGLLLVFRNSTAFGRWDDGRKLFISLNTQIRCLARVIWLHVRIDDIAPPPRRNRAYSLPSKDNDEDDDNEDDNDNQGDDDDDNGNGNESGTRGMSQSVGSTLIGSGINNNNNNNGNGSGRNTKRSSRHIRSSSPDQQEEDDFGRTQPTMRQTSRGEKLFGQKRFENDSVKERERRNKRKVLRLLVGFVISVKHHARGEFGSGYEDLKPVLPLKFLENSSTKASYSGFGFGSADADRNRGDSYPSSPNLIPPTTVDPTTGGGPGGQNESSGIKSGSRSGSKTKIGGKGDSDGKKVTLSEEPLVEEGREDEAGEEGEREEPLTMKTPLLHKLRRRPASSTTGTAEEQQEEGSFASDGGSKGIGGLFSSFGRRRKHKPHDVEEGSHRHSHSRSRSHSPLKPSHHPHPHHRHRHRSPSPYSQVSSISSARDDDDAVVLHNLLARPSLPLPLIIAHQLGMWVQRWKRMGILEEGLGPAGFWGMNTAVTQLVDTFGQIERIATMSIPLVYGVHLKQCVTLYLFALPFTLVESMGWKMIPFVTLVAFTLMGIEGIASEIEMPFGHDQSDLPLDLLCAELRNEIEFYMARLPEGGAELGEFNQLW